MKKSYDGIVGLALADAMGVPFEFHSREQMKKHPATNITGYGTYYMPEGCWSDDTSLTLATMDGIIKNNGKINIKTYDFIADNFAAYYYNSSFTPTGEMFDIGNTTSTAIKRYASGQTTPINSGGKSVENSGNGALMRILPIAYYAYQNNLSNEDIIEITSNISSITHGLSECKLGSYIYTQFAKKLLETGSKNESYQYIQQLNYSHFPKGIVNLYSRILNSDISKLSENEISSIGKTIPTLEASLWSFLNSSSYTEAVLKAINLGNDTDTIGACTGGLAGILYGADTIPIDWISKLKRIEYLEDLSNAFDISIVNKSIPTIYKQKLSSEGSYTYGKKSSDNLIR